MSRNRDAEFIRRLYGRYDPARGITAAGQAHDAAVAHLAELNSQPHVAEVRSPAGRMVGPTRRRLLVAGTATAAAAAAGGLAAAWSGAWSGVGQPARGQAAAGPVATPKLLSLDNAKSDMSATQVLLKAAASAERRPDTTGTGRYQYVDTWDWSEILDVIPQGFKPAVMPVHTQQWIAADGSGRIIEWDQPTYFPDPADRDKSVRSPRRFDNTYGPGGLALKWQPGSLSTVPSVLRQQLEQGYGSSAYAPLKSVSALYAEQPVSPAVRAAVLRMLAAVPGLRYDGTGTDRVGRSGIGISLDTDGFRFVLIFDPVTGQLLDSEQVGLTRHRYDPPAPFVAEYTVYLASARTNQTTVPPA